MALGWKGILFVIILIVAAVFAYNYFVKDYQAKPLVELFRLAASDKKAESTAARREIMKRVEGGSVPAAEVVKRLDDPAAPVRAIAAESAGKLKLKEQMPKMIAMFKDLNAEVRAAAAGSFQNFRCKEVVEPLIGLLDDSEESVRLAASESLRYVTGQKFTGQGVSRWRQWWDSEKNTWQPAGQ
jgi:HEAT repeat protein